MKKVTIILFILHEFCLGQSLKSKKREIGFSFSPNFCHMIVNTSGYNSKITPRFGFTTGATLWFKKSKKLSIESGLLFSNFGIRFFDDKPKYSIISEENIYNYYSLNIAVKFKYFVNQGESKFYLSGGAALNWLLATRYRTTLIYNGNVFRDYHTDFDAIILPLPNLIIGVGRKFTFSNSLSLKIEPTLRLTPNVEGILSPNPASFAINNPFYSAGVDFGIYYTLK